MRRITQILFLLLMFVSVVGCDEDILHDLDELRANETLLILERAQIPAEKVRSGKEWNIRVPKAQAVQALSVLEQSRILVRDRDRYKEQSHGLMQSREEREEARERQLAWDLETTIEQIPGVREAKVHLSLDGDVSLSKNKARPPSTASVLLVTVSDDQNLIEKVKQLVSGATALPLIQVSVVMTKLEEPVTKSVVAAKAANLDLRPLLYPILGGFLLVVFVAGTLRRMKRQPKMLASLAHAPLRPQMPIPEPLHVRREDMELQ